MKSSFQIEPLDDTRRVWANQLLEQHWGNTVVITRGKAIDASRLPGFVAVLDAAPVGLVTYHIDDRACELVTLNSLAVGYGIGSALVEAVKQAAIAANCHRLWLITTNDNLPALGFYQKRGFRTTAVHPNALDLSRRLKPEIPLLGLNGIPLRDEIELEMRLD